MCLTCMIFNSFELFKKKVVSWDDAILLTYIQKSKIRTNGSEYKYKYK